MSQGEAKRPLASFSVGGYSVALWENPFDNGDGSQRLVKSVSLRKAFYNKKDQKLEEQKIHIGPAELGCVIGLLTEMERTVIERRGAEPF